MIIIHYSDWMVHTGKRENSVVWVRVDFFKKSATHEMRGSGGGSDTLRMIADVAMSEESRGGKRNDRTGK